MLPRWLVTQKVAQQRGELPKHDVIAPSQPGTYQITVVAGLCRDGKLLGDDIVVHPAEQIEQACSALVIALQAACREERCEELECVAQLLQATRSACRASGSESLVSNANAATRLARLFRNAVRIQSAVASCFPPERPWRR